MGDGKSRAGEETVRRVLGVEGSRADSVDLTGMRGMVVVRSPREALGRVRVGYGS